MWLLMAFMSWYVLTVVQSADGFHIVQVDVNTEVGVVRDIRLKELRIYTDYGRCSRPLFIVDKQRLLIKKKDIHSLQQRVSSE
jgi:hypothetical protein